MVIYKITNLINGMIYVGQTAQKLKRRFDLHWYAAKNLNSRKKSLLWQAMWKYGKENFVIDALEECETREQLNEREKFWIAELACKEPNGYNQSDGGKGTPGLKRSEESIKKVTLANTGKNRSPETCARISKAKTNPSAETRARLSESHKGKTHTVSEAARKKISVANKGRKRTPEQIQKMMENRQKHRNNKDTN